MSEPLTKDKVTGRNCTVTLENLKSALEYFEKRINHLRVDRNMVTNRDVAYLCDYNLDNALRIIKEAFPAIYGDEKK